MTKESKTAEKPKAAEPEAAQMPFIVGSWSGQPNYECNVAENEIPCEYKVLDWELMRQHLTGHGVFIASKKNERPRFTIGPPVPNREAEETVAPPPPLPTELPPVGE